MKIFLYFAVLTLAGCAHVGATQIEAPHTCDVIRAPWKYSGEIVKLTLWVKPGIPSFYNNNCLQNFLVPIPPYGEATGDDDLFREMVVLNQDRDDVGVEAEIVARVVWPPDAAGMTDHGLQFLEIQNPRLVAVPGVANLPSIQDRRDTSVRSKSDTE